MFVDKTVDALAITDAEIASDWKLGMVRSMGRLLAKRGDLDKGNISYYSSIPTADSAYVHVRGAAQARELCTITAVRNVVEDSMEFEDGGTFGSTTRHRTLLTGEADCACGKLVGAHISYEVYIGDLISALANA